MPTSSPTSPASAPKETFWSKLLGWGVGVVLPVFLPQLTTPAAELVLPFELGGAVSGFVGFTAMYFLLPYLSRMQKMVSTVAALVLGLLAAGVYRQLLYSASNTSPTQTVEWLEFGLFCIAYFGIFAALAPAFRAGMPAILRRMSIPKG